MSLALIRASGLTMPPGWFSAPASRHADVEAHFDLRAGWFFSPPRPCADAGAARGPAPPRAGSTGNGRLRWQTPLARQERETIIETTLGALPEGDTTHLAEAEAIVAYAEALKTGATADLAAALDRVEALADRADRADPDLVEIDGLLREHPAMANP